MTSPFDLNLDLRALALSRMALGVLIIYDLLDRSRFLAAHYGPDGVVRSSMLGSWSLHLGSTSWVSALFFLQGLLALLMLLGWRTRWVTAGSWFLLVSLHHRNSMILYGADSMVALTLLWGVFMPWGRAWSLDESREGKAESYHIRSPLAFVWIAQIALVYLITALRKSGPQWTDGTAVYHALTAFQYYRPLGSAFRELVLGNPFLGWLLTWLVLVWEYAVGLLAFTRWKSWAGLSILLFHLGVSLTLSVGFFPVASSIQALSLLHFKEERSKLSFKAPNWSLGLAGILMAFSGILGFLSLFDATRAIPEKLLPAVNHLRLQQTWNMFAPSPPTRHGWYSAKGTLQDGSEIDLLYGGPFKSQPPSEHLPRESMRWSTLCFLTYTRYQQRYSPILIDYLKREWESVPREQALKRIELIYFVADIVPFEDQPFQSHVVQAQNL